MNNVRNRVQALSGVHENSKTQQRDPDLGSSLRKLASEIASRQKEQRTFFETLSDWSGFFEERVEMLTEIQSELSMLGGGQGKQLLAKASADDLNFIMSSLTHLSELMDGIRSMMLQVDRFLGLVEDLSTLQLVDPFGEVYNDVHHAVTRTPGHPTNQPPRGT